MAIPHRHARIRQQRTSSVEPEINIHQIRRKIPMQCKLSLAIWMSIYQPQACLKGTLFYTKHSQEALGKADLHLLMTKKENTQPK